MQLREKPAQKNQDSTVISRSVSPEFFSVFLRNCINWVHNCEDRSSFDFISAVLIRFISYTSITV